MPADLEDLQQRLTHYPVQRYPVQHATVCFHLGSLHLQAGRPQPAADALTTAQEVFGRCRMGAEAAKAGLMLGIAWREDGRLPAAADQFEAVAAALTGTTQEAERGAALYNLGLVRADLGQPDEAARAWQQARTVFVAAGQLGQAAAATRDLAVSLLTAERAVEAVDLLTEAMPWAEAAADAAGTGATANLLGLALLATGEPAAALPALQLAASCFPRSLRPAEHAMATANLALAHEALGRPVRARVLARQALAVAQAQAPVREQARQLLSRSPGDPAADMQALVGAEAVSDWQPLLRVELTGAAAAGAGPCRALLDVVLAAVARDTDPDHPSTDAYERAEGLLTLVLELPPGPFRTVLVALDAAATDPERAEQERERLRSVLASALARFAIPQWQRAVAGLNEAAQTRDGGSPWS